ncbi:MAG: hypothetical protein DWP97_14190 [Calditrichaeota bacterium]|nr:MAG: hypothetical protein DWP97_14190 [Calditrichota bacterium]
MPAPMHESFGDQIIQLTLLRTPIVLIWSFFIVQKKRDTFKEKINSSSPSEEEKFISGLKVSFEDS